VALLDKPGVDDLVEYETRLNYVLPKYDDPVICTYDLSKFSASVVMDIMRTHPVVIIGGVHGCDRTPASGRRTASASARQSCHDHGAADGFDCRRNQPADRWAVVSNAQAALRWLDMQPPNPQEVRESLGRIVKDGRRASEVIGRIRALVRRAPPRKEQLGINDAIREVIALTLSELRRNAIFLRMQLADGVRSGRSRAISASNGQSDRQRRRGADWRQGRNSRIDDRLPESPRAPRVGRSSAHGSRAR
jgi:hypothetical protein